MKDREYRRTKLDKKGRFVYKKSTPGDQPYYAWKWQWPWKRKLAKNDWAKNQKSLDAYPFKPELTIRYTFIAIENEAD